MNSLISLEIHGLRRMYYILVSQRRFRFQVFLLMEICLQNWFHIVCWAISFENNTLRLLYNLAAHHQRHSADGKFFELDIFSVSLSIGMKRMFSSDGKATVKNGFGGKRKWVNSQWKNDYVESVSIFTAAEQIETRLFARLNRIFHSFFRKLFFLLLHFHSVCYFILNHFACKWIRNSIKLWHEVFMGITPTRDNWKRLHFYLKCFAAVLRLNFRFEDRYWIESGLRNSASDWRKTEWHCTD